MVFANLSGPFLRIALHVSIAIIISQLADDTKLPEKCLQDSSCDNVVKIWTNGRKRMECSNYMWNPCEGSAIITKDQHRRSPLKKHKRNETHGYKETYPWEEEHCCEKQRAHPHSLLWFLWFRNNIWLVGRLYSSVKEYAVVFDAVPSAVRLLLGGNNVPPTHNMDLSDAGFMQSIGHLAFQICAY